MFCILKKSDEEFCELNVKSLIFENDQEKFQKSLDKLAKQIEIEILCSFFVPKEDKVEHHFVIRPDEDLDIMYRFADTYSNKWMNAEERMNFQNLDLQFKILDEG